LKVQRSYNGQKKQHYAKRVNKFDNHKIQTSLQQIFFSINSPKIISEEN
jgi:hypothetical protein